MDNDIFFFLYNFSGSYKVLDQAIIFFAHIFPYLVVLFAFLFLLFSKKNFGYFTLRLKRIFLVFFSATGAWFISYVLKLFIKNERPFDLFSQVVPLLSESGYAFPSGHATFFMALAFSFFFINKKIGLPAQTGYLFIFFALLIGLARIMAGVHFPVDILGGFLLGFFIAFFLKNI